MIEKMAIVRPFCQEHRSEPHDLTKWFDKVQSGMQRFFTTREETDAKGHRRRALEAG
jgi:hypothetical protein